MLLPTARTEICGPSLIALALVAGIHLEAAPSRAHGDDWANFGFSLAADDDLLVVAADNEAQLGVAYVFRRSGDRWGLLQRIAPSQSSISGFGQSMAINGKIVVAGNVQEKAAGARAVGAAYVFEARGAAFPQVETQILTAPQPRPYSGFGESVAVHGEMIAVGAPADGNGAVYLYRKKGNRWTNAGKRTGQDSPDDLFGAMFGRCVAMSEKFLVVGAPLQRVPKQGRAGAIYIYRRADDGSVLEPPQMLTPPPGRAVEELGTSLAIRETEILAGASGIDDGRKREVGGALLFTAGADGKFQAEPAALYIPAEGAADERAGARVALTADYAMVASSLASKQKGCVYVFPRNASDKDPPRRLTFPPLPLGEGRGEGGASPDSPSRATPRTSRDAPRRGKGAATEGGASAGSAARAKGRASRDTSGGIEVTAEAASGGPPSGFGGALAISGGELLVGAYQLEKNGRVVPYTLDKSGQWKPGEPFSPNSPPAKRGKKK